MSLNINGEFLFIKILLIHNNITITNGKVTTNKRDNI